MEKGKTINLREVLYRILLKRRALLIWMIVFAFLANGFACLKSYREVSQINQDVDNVDYSQYESGLSEIEIEEVKNAVDDYLTYEQTYKQYRNYMDSSIKMQLDANAVSTKKIIYRIDGNNDSVNITDTYMEMFPDNEICQEIADQLKLDTDLQYIKELISVKSSYLYTINVDDQQYANVLENNASNDAPVLLVIKIVFDNRKDVDAIGDIVKESMNQVTQQLENRFGQFNIYNISESYSIEADQELLQEQQTTLNEMNSVSSLMKNAESSLTETQKPYFTALLEDDIEQLDAGNLENSGQVRTVDYINLKYIIIGAGAGLILFALYILCRVIFDRHLNSVCYIEQDLKSPLLGVLRESRGNKKIKDKIDNKLAVIFKQDNRGYTQEEQIKIICTNLGLLIKKKGINSIFITGSHMTEKMNKILSALELYLKDNNINFVTEKNFLNDAESLRKFSETESVLFIERMNESFNDDIFKETEYCNKYNIENLGFIIVE